MQSFMTAFWIVLGVCAAIVCVIAGPSVAIWAGRKVYAWATGPKAKAQAKVAVAKATKAGKRGVRAAAGKP
jgi:hypothetical protein